MTDSSNTDQHLVFGNAIMYDESKEDDIVDRPTLFYNSIILDLQANLDDDNIDMETVSNLLEILCNSIQGIFDITTLIDSDIFLYIIDTFPQNPIFISKIIKNALNYTSYYDDFIINQKTFLIDIIKESRDDDLTNNIISIVATMASRHPDLMIEFISVLYTKKINTDFARYIYNIIPVAQKLIKDDEDYIKLTNLISQIIISNDLDVILIGINILLLAIKLDDQILMQSFGKSQLQYESLLYYEEVKKIAAGYHALSITMSCIKNRNQCIENASNILPLAEKHIKLIPNVLKKSIIHYICEYSRITKNCIPEDLFIEIMMLANEGNFLIRSDATNCIAICIIETKRKIDDIELLIDIFSNHIGGNNEVAYNIIDALQITFDYVQMEDDVNTFCLEVLCHIDFDELLQNDDEDIHDAAQNFFEKIMETQN